MNLSHLNSCLETASERVEKNVEAMPQIPVVARKIRPHSPDIADAVQQIDIDAPLTISFCFICVLVQLLTVPLGQRFSINYFSIPTIRYFSFTSPMSYVRIFSQTIGHSSWGHLSGNITHMLLVGPVCEREFGAYNMLKIMLCTCVASSIGHLLLGTPAHGVQLGASGMAFMFILLNSLVEARLGRIPLTFICQVFLWCTKEVVGQLYGNDQVSHVAHLSGAIVGTLAGYHLHVEKVHTRVAEIGRYWQKKNKKG